MILSILTPSSTLLLPISSFFRLTSSQTIDYFSYLHASVLHHHLHESDPRFEVYSLTRAQIASLSIQGKLTFPSYHSQTLTVIFPLLLLNLPLLIFLRYTTIVYATASLFL